MERSIIKRFHAHLKKFDTQEFQRLLNSCVVSFVLKEQMVGIIRDKKEMIHVLYSNWSLNIATSSFDYIKIYEQTEQ